MLKVGKIEGGGYNKGSGGKYENVWHISYG